MNLKLEVVFMFFGGLIRLVVIIADIWYLLTIDYHSDLFYYFAVASLVAPSFIMMVIYISAMLCDCCSGQFSSFKLYIALLFILGDTIGVNYFIFTVVLCTSKMRSGDFFIVEGIFRAGSMINSVFQSMPQLILQVYNNEKLQHWSLFSIFSVGISALSLVYNCTKLVHAIDKIGQFESISAKIKPKNEVKISKSTDSLPINQLNSNRISTRQQVDDDEVYPESP